MSEMKNPRYRLRFLQVQNPRRRSTRARRRSAPHSDSWMGRYGMISSGATYDDRECPVDAAGWVGDDIVRIADGERFRRAPGLMQRPYVALRGSDSRAPVPGWCCLRRRASIRSSGTVRTCMARSSAERMRITIQLRSNCHHWSPWRAL